MENTLKNAYEFLSELSDAAPKMSLPEALVEYATSVRPVVVLPSDVDKKFPSTIAQLGRNMNEDERGEDDEISFFMDNFFMKNGIRWILEELRRLNPDMTFTEPIPHGLEPELPAKCYKCGGKMVIVRPGEWQCEKCGY